MANNLWHMHFCTFVWAINGPCCFIFVARTMEIIFFSNEKNFSIIFTVNRGWIWSRPYAWSPTCYRKCAYRVSPHLWVYWCDDQSLYFKLKHPTLPIWTQCSSLHTLKILIYLVLHFWRNKRDFVCICFPFMWRWVAREKPFENSAGGS